jgi:hypothetical protein
VKALFIGGHFDRQVMEVAGDLGRLQLPIPKPVTFEPVSDVFPGAAYDVAVYQPQRLRFESPNGRRSLTAVVWVDYPRDPLEILASIIAPAAHPSIEERP